MDFDLEEHLSTLEKKPYEDGWTEGEWEEDFDTTAIFMNEAPTQEEIDASPTLSAIQAIKYEEEKPEDLALEHKEDGNQQFKKKLYRFAIKAYTEGIKLKCSNNELNAVLYTNRAAAHSHIENYMSSLKDALRGLKYKPDHMKAIIRCIDCCLEMRRFTEAIDHCDKGLLVEPGEKRLVDKRAQAVKGKKAQERDERKRKVQAGKVKANQNGLLTAIKERNVQLRQANRRGLDKPSKAMSADELIKCLRLDTMSEYKVSLDESGSLHWPVRLLYPEHSQSDVISAFDENSRFLDHFVVMFNPEDDIPWDKAKSYRIDNIEIYFEDFDGEQLVKFDPDKALWEVLQDSRCHVYQGQPTFVILLRASDFRDQYLSQYGQK